MSVYYKVSGAWQLVQEPYWKAGGIYKPARAVYLKTGGVWEPVYEYDITPPDPPTIELAIVENDEGGRWIRVGIRSPNSNHDTNLRRIRVLTTYNGAMPTTYNGGSYWSKSDDNWPNEPWSEWRYNYSAAIPYTGNHQDSSSVSYKQWPINPGTTTRITGGQTYHFAAWSEDLYGNWSVGNFAAIAVPKDGVDAPNVVKKEARFQANSSGSYTANGFAAGVLTQQANPISRGLWFHGQQLSDSIGNSGPVTIKSAQIQVQRGEDNGQPTANVYLFWHGYSTSAGLPESSPSFSNTTLVGTINKGETKWFTIPSTFNTHYNSDIKGFGLSHKDPIKAAAGADDYSVMKSTTDSLRSGEVHLVWEEQL
jgi:hypothetical protein